MSELTVIIEIPKDSNLKYEMCKETGELALDRVLHDNLMYPQNYGYIENTLAEDGDELDVVVIAPPILPKTRVPIRVLGMLEMEDDGVSDPKIIATPYFTEEIKSEDRTFMRLSLEIEAFFYSYKEPGVVKTGKLFGERVAKDEIQACIERRRNNYPIPPIYTSLQMQAHLKFWDILESIGNKLFKKRGT